MGRAQGHREEIPAIPAKPTPGNTPEAGLGPERQEPACCEVLSVEDGSLPYLPTPSMDEGEAHLSVLVVPLQDRDPGASPQVLPTLETPAEGGGAEEDREREGPVQDPGPLRRRAMRQGDDSGC